MSDLTPEQRAEAIRLLKERYPDAELSDDMEIAYYLFPMNREETDDNIAKPKRSQQPRGEEGDE